jgi:nitrile hydratase accessory protein
MTQPADRADDGGLLASEGPTAPPRRNGELVFAAPWESRLFGLTMALHRDRLFVWEDFQRLLIDEIQSWERAHPSGEAWSYYERWQAAFERLLAAKDVCAPDEVMERAAILARRPPDHDHR